MSFFRFCILSTPSSLSNFRILICNKSDKNNHWQPHENCNNIFDFWLHSRMFRCLVKNHQKLIEDKKLKYLYISRETEKKPIQLFHLQVYFLDSCETISFVHSACHKFGLLAAVLFLSVFYYIITCEEKLHTGTRTHKQTHDVLLCPVY